MSEHTPTPWAIDCSDSRVWCKLLLVNGKCIGYFRTDEDTNFAFKACNNHDALVSALNAFVEEGVEHTCDECGGDLEDCPDDCCLRIGRAVLTAVKS